MIKRTAFLMLLSVVSTSLFGQNKVVYPQVAEGFKRVDFILPKVENPEKYRVEITFSFEAEVVACSNADFNFNTKNIEKGYGIGSRFPYYVFNVKGVEISEGYNKGCDSKQPKAKRKIFSSYKTIEEYQSVFVIPYYIPKYWNLEYRIFKADNAFKEFK